MTGGTIPWPSLRTSPGWGNCAYVAKRIDAPDLRRSTKPVKFVVRMFRNYSWIALAADKDDVARSDADKAVL